MADKEVSKDEAATGDIPADNAVSAIDETPPAPDPDKGNWFPVGKDGANIYYTSQKECELQEKYKCLEVTGKDLRYWILDGKGGLVLDKQLQADAEAADAAAKKAIEDQITEKETLIAELKASGDQNILKLLKVLDL